MKKSILLTAILLCFISVFAQRQLLVQHNNQGLFLVHKVAPKENFFAIGRLYHVAPKDIAAFNGLDMDKGLVVDQAVKIPLNTTNFSQSSDQGKPVYYVVGQKEGLYRVSQNNNNVLMANLRKWNKLTKDEIKPGQKLIVGYIVAAEATNITQNKVQEEEPKKETTYADQVKVDKSEQIKKEPQIQKKEDPAIKDERKADAPVKPIQVAMTDGKGGYFKSHFESQVKSHPAKTEVTASAGIFKTSSGWEDGKYYALMDGVEPGTIIKVVNPTNSKVIYAKVLGEMSGIRQNQGYDIRISNAAASALQVADTEKFVAKVNY